MANEHLSVVGVNQRRYRSRLAKKGWKGICTYMTAEHRTALERVQREHELRTLHEALALALSRSALPPFNGVQSPLRRNLPSLTVE
jgi:hypothetical protein